MQSDAQLEESICYFDNQSKMFGQTWNEPHLITAQWKMLHCFCKSILSLCLVWRYNKSPWYKQGHKKQENGFIHRCSVIKIILIKLCVNNMIWSYWSNFYHFQKQKYWNWLMWFKIKGYTDQNDRTKEKKLVSLSYNLKPGIVLWFIPHVMIHI